MLSLLFIKMIIKLIGNTYILKIQNSDFLKILSNESKMDLEDLRGCLIPAKFSAVLATMFSIKY